MVLSPSYKKYEKYLVLTNKEINIFDYLYESLMDESMEYIMNRARDLGEVMCLCCLYP